MNIRYDKVADAVYVQMSEAAVAETEKLNDTTVVDKDKDGNVVGLEILDASSQEGFIRALEGNVSDGVPVSIVNSTPLVAA